MWTTVSQKKEREAKTVAACTELHAKFADLKEETITDLVYSWRFWGKVDVRTGIDVDSLKEAVAKYIWAHVVTFTEPLTDEKIDSYIALEAAYYRCWNALEKELNNLLNSWDRDDLDVGFYNPKNVEDITHISGSYQYNRRIAIMRYDKYLRGVEDPMTDLEVFAWDTGGTVAAPPRVVKEILGSMLQALGVSTMFRLVRNHKFEDFKVLFRKPPNFKKIKTDPALAKAKRRGYLKDNLRVGSYSVGACRSSTSQALEEAGKSLEKVLYHAKLHKGSLSSRVPEEVAEINKLIEELEDSVTCQVETIKRHIHTLSRKITANNFD